MDESLLLRQIPHSVEAEQAVLGAMLIDSRCIPEVVEALTPADFYLKTNRQIYETIYTMFSFSASTLWGIWRSNRDSSMDTPPLTGKQSQCPRERAGGVSPPR